MEELKNKKTISLKAHVLLRKELCDKQELPEYEEKHWHKNKTNTLVENDVSHQDAGKVKGVSIVIYKHFKPKATHGRTWIIDPNRTIWTENKYYEVKFSAFLVVESKIHSSSRKRLQLCISQSVIMSLLHFIFTIP